MTTDMETVWELNVGAGGGGRWRWAEEGKEEKGKNWDNCNIITIFKRFFKK